MSRRQHCRRTHRHAIPAAVLYACEPLEPRTLLATIVIQAVGPNAQVTLSSHTAFRPIREEFVDYKAFAGDTTHSVLVNPLTVDTVLVKNAPGDTMTVTVLSTLGIVLGTTLQYDGTGGASATANLGGGPNGMQSLLGQVTLTGLNGGRWLVNADDTADTTPRTLTLTDGLLTGLAPANITWTTGQVGGITVNTDTAGGNTVNIPGPLTTLLTTFIGHSTGADDALTIGNAANGASEIADSGVELPKPSGTPPTGLWNITLNDKADTVHHSLNVFANQVQLLKMSALDADVSWDPSMVRSVTAIVSGNVDVIDNSVPLTLVASNLEQGVDLAQDITGPVTLIAVPGNNWNLGIDDSADTSSRTVTLHTVTVPSDPTVPYGAIDGLAAATILYRYNSVFQISIRTWSGAGEINVRATGVPTSFTVRNAIPINVGDTGSLQNIQGPIVALPDMGLSPSPTVLLNLEDSADVVARHVSFTASPDLAKISGLAPVPIDVLPLTPGFPLTAQISIDGGSGGNAFTLAGGAFASIPPVNLAINTGSGNNTVFINGSGTLVPTVVNGGSGNDAFTVDLSSLSLSQLALDGGPGKNTLEVIGPKPTSAVTVTASAITSGANSIQYAAFQDLIFQTGQFTLSGDLGGMSVSTTSAGPTAPTTLLLPATQHLGAVSIGDGTSVTLASSPAPAGKTLFCTSLTIAGSGRFDLANNALQLTYAAGADPIASIRSYLTNGFDNGTWNGTGIITSAGNPTHVLGFGDSADGVISGLPANTLLVRFTRFGDVNLDGQVGFPDLIAVARNYGKTGENWDQGNLIYGGGAVGFSDLLLVARNYGASAAVRAASAVFAAAPLELPIVRRRRQ